MTNPRWLILASIGSCCLPVAAADFYMNLAGAGTKSGSSWANALPASSMAATVNTTMQPGDSLFLEGANYADRRFTITSSGSSSARKSLIGVDRGAGLPVFVGAQSTRSYTTISLGANAGYWTIKNLRIERRDIGLNAVGPNPGLIIDGVTIRDFRSKGFSLTNCDNLLIQNCRAERYNEKGFMFNSACDGVTVKKCVADCTGTGSVVDTGWRAVANDPVGFDFHFKGSTAPPNTNILLEDCESLNNDEDTATTGDYEQGDGFKMEGSNSGITLKRCHAHHNQDAAFDLKGASQTLESCVAQNSRYGFKLWYSGNISNCIAVSNWARQLMLPATTKGNTITATLCTFHSATNTQLGVGIETSGNTAVLNDCIISFAGAAGTYTAGGTVTLNGTVKHANTSNTANVPKYKNPIVPWSGIGTNYDNDTYVLTKGFSSTRISSPPALGAISVNLTSTANLLASTDQAGAVPAANWNNSTVNNEVLSNVKDNAGVATTADITLGSTAYFYTNSTGTLASPMADDVKLMKTQRALSNASTISATAVQIPYAVYDVYVYWGGRTASEPVPVTMTVEFQLNNAGTYSTVETKYIKDGDYLWDGTYNESTATTAAGAVDGNEYVVFRNVTAASFRIRATTGVRTGICGFQIVKR